MAARTRKSRHSCVAPATTSVTPAKRPRSSACHDPPHAAPSPQGPDHESKLPGTALKDDDSDLPLGTVIDYAPLPLLWEHGDLSFVALQTREALHSEGAAQALGLTIPLTLLARADEVIE